MKLTVASWCCGDMLGCKQRECVFELWFESNSRRNRFFCFVVNNANALPCIDTKIHFKRFNREESCFDWYWKPFCFLIIYTISIFLFSTSTSTVDNNNEPSRCGFCFFAFVSNVSKSIWGEKWYVSSSDFIFDC